jgi:hypothetical protein
MKKRSIIIILVLGLIILGGAMYWSGYLVFNGPIPSFNPNPGSASSNQTAGASGTPKLVIESVKGRWNKITAVITNTGTADAESVSWNISVTGGILKRINVRTTGTVNTLTQGSSTTITSGRIPFGLGRLQITVTAKATLGDMVIKSAKGFKLFFLVIGVHT